MFLDILINSLLILAILVVWAFAIVFLVCVFKNLKKMPKQPDLDEDNAVWMTMEEFKAFLDEEERRQGSLISINNYRAAKGLEPFNQDMAIREYDKKEQDNV